MIPAGYMAKRVKASPIWLQTDKVKDIYSVSSCVSNDFTDTFSFWSNGYWFYDSPEVIRNIAQKNGISLDNCTLFYYEVYGYQFDEINSAWRSFVPETTQTLNVSPPKAPKLQGFDVVSFSVGTNPECSPLSCSGLAKEIQTNRHCLISSFEAVKQLLEAGSFTKSEPGPFRVFAVYSMEWPS